jgi:two-component SAPR family response regulator
MGGPDLVGRVRKIRPEIKVIFMSGYTDTTIVHNGVLDAKANFLQKPFTAELLERKIREALDSDARTA